MRKNNYDLLFESLFNTSTSKALRRKVRDNIDKMSIVKYDFRGWDNNNTPVVPVFFISYGYELFEAYKYYFTIPLWRLIKIINVNDIVRNHMNIDVPSYNCKRTTILHGGMVSTTYGSRRQGSFFNWFIGALNEDLKDIINKKDLFIESEIKKIIKSEEYLAKEKESIKKIAIDDIVSVLMEYDSLDPSVIRRGLLPYLDINDLY